MVNYIVTADDLDGISDLNIDNYVYVKQGVLVSNPVNDPNIEVLGIEMGDGARVFVHGAVNSGVGVRLGTATTDQGARLIIGTTGVVEGYFLAGSAPNGFAVDLFGSASSLQNAGLITSDYIGVQMLSGGSITNTGTILGLASAVRAELIDSLFQSANFEIQNSGYIGSVEVRDTTLDGGIVEITNTGELDSFAYFYSGPGDGSEGNILFINTGIVSGNVVLSSGADVLDNRHGEITGAVALGDGADIFRNANGAVLGEIFGDLSDGLVGGADNFYGSGDAEIMHGDGGNDVIRGEGGDDELFGDSGNDTLRGGAGYDELDGGDGNDFASYFFDGAIVLALDGSLVSSGAVTDDTLVSIESISGSNTGADTLVGDGFDNKLYGNGGADNLTGGSGVDTLRGGAGIDTMNGGVGADTYQYTATTEGGDLIGSFSSIDFFAFKSSAFGGIAIGGLDSTAFQSRATDNLAQDTNDRFIFRQSDSTLWYDSNGSTGGSSNAILIADITVTATVTAGDISIFA